MTVAILLCIDYVYFQSFKKLYGLEMEVEVVRWLEGIVHLKIIKMLLSI